MIPLSAEQRDFLRRCGVSRSRDFLDAMARLREDLLQANRRTNLTRITSPEAFRTLHVLDSLSAGLALPELLTAALRVADVGSGAGFPLLPLAAVNSKLQIVGIEPRRRKIAFLQREIERLGLTSARAVCARAREAGRTEGLAGTFDLVLLRAVGPAGALLRECRALLKPVPGGCILFYKTPASVRAEEPLARREAKKFGLAMETTDPFCLPGDGGERQFLLFRNESPSGKND